MPGEKKTTGNITNMSQTYFYYLGDGLYGFKETHYIVAVLIQPRIFKIIFSSRDERNFVEKRLLSSLKSILPIGFLFNNIKQLFI